MNGYSEWESMKKEKDLKIQQAQIKAKRDFIESQQAGRSSMSCSVGLAWQCSPCFLFDLEKAKKYLEAQKKYDEWEKKKMKKIDQTNEMKKKIHDEQLKQAQLTRESQFIASQTAYDAWLKAKDDSEIGNKLQRSRQNSITGKQQQQTKVPFLPSGSKTNAGKIQHIVW
jgi:predicted metal-binding transcription factor (methanogenesis marker protein 9)